MKNTFRNICLALIISAFCASPALANQMNVGENPGAINVQMNEGALFKRAVMACKENSESQECISAKEAWENEKANIHKELETKHELFENVKKVCKGDQNSDACLAAKRAFIGPKRTQLQPSN